MASSEESLLNTYARGQRDPRERIIGDRLAGLLSTFLNRPLEAHELEVCRSIIADIVEVAASHAYRRNSPLGPSR